MKLSHEEVLKIANLARLELSSEEVEKYSTQLSSILNYVQKLNELPDGENQETSPPQAGVEGKAPAALPMEGATRAPMIKPTPLRADEVVADKTLEASLKNAPSAEGTLFKVPKVIE